MNRAMNFRQYTDNEGRVLYEPENKMDRAIFKHCSGDLVAVTLEYMRETVSPVLYHHGILTGHILDANGDIVKVPS